VSSIIARHYELTAEELTVERWPEAMMGRLREGRVGGGEVPSRKALMTKRAAREFGVLA
jgi:hypothetical protein